jgi:hypothetical protein
VHYILHQASMSMEGIVVFAGRRPQPSSSELSPLARLCLWLGLFSCLILLVDPAWIAYFMIVVIWLYTDGLFRFLILVCLIAASALFCLCRMVLS